MGKGTAGDRATGPATGPQRVGGFLGGVVCYVAALRFLKEHPRLQPLVIIPFCLTLLLFAGVGVAGFLWFSSWQASWWEGAEGWLAGWPIVQTVLDWMLRIVFVLVYGFVCYLTFLTVGSLITSPFNELLSQRAERILRPDLAPPAGGLWAMVADMLRGLKHECLRLAILLGLYLVLAPLLLLPLVGPPTFAVVLVVVGIRYLAWDGLDYCMARRRLRFREKMRFLRTHRARTLGFGSVSFVLLLVPLTTIFVLPLNALAGTILYCRIAGAVAGTGGGR